MISFKLWMQLENGPGGNGTLDDPNADMVSRTKADARMGVGAFHQGGDRPPLVGSGFPKGYLDPSHRKAMRKYMTKDTGKLKNSSCKISKT